MLYPCLTTTHQKPQIPPTWGKGQRFRSPKESMDRFTYTIECSDSGTWRNCFNSIRSALPAVEADLYISYLGLCAFFLLPSNNRRVPL